MSPSYSHDHLGSVWCLSEPSEDPYSSNQSGSIFSHFLQQTGSRPPPSSNSDFYPKIYLILYHQTLNSTTNIAITWGNLEGPIGDFVLDAGAYRTSTSLRHWNRTWNPWSWLNWKSCGNHWLSRIEIFQTNLALSKVR